MLESRYITPEILLNRGLKAINEEKNNNKKNQTLGDRRTYIGASDLCGCPRVKLMEKFKKAEDTFSSYIHKQKGNLAEKLILPLFLKNQHERLNVFYQLEYKSNLSSFLKCHYDFIIETEKCYFIIEMKTANKNSESQYKNQIMAEIGLFEENKEKDKPVYGYFLFVDLNSAEYEFSRNKYEYNHTEYLKLIKKADQMGNALEMYKEDKSIFDAHAIETYWCDYCPSEFYFSCPKKLNSSRDAIIYASEEHYEIAKEYALLKMEKDRVEKEFKNIKDFIGTLVKLNEPTKIGDILFKKSISSRTNVDKKKLEKELFPMAQKYFYSTKFETLRDSL
jgi:CRISPR-associated exonuclease Cas4